MAEPDAGVRRVPDTGQTRARRVPDTGESGTATSGRRGNAMTSLDPISFEVIRNALVAATDEMVLALKRSAYSTNIKTR